MATGTRDDVRIPISEKPKNLESGSSVQPTHGDREWANQRAPRMQRSGTIHGEMVDNRIIGRFLHTWRSLIRLLTVTVSGLDRGSGLENLGWLSQIVEEPDPRRTSERPPIQKVAQTLRRITRNEACFNPFVVSFGPYHHGKDHLKPMERCKEVAALWFIKKLSDNRVNAITSEEAKKVYDDFVAKVPTVSSLRDCYTDNFVDTINDADFMRMMFLDGCFMLYFIQLCLDQSNDLFETSHLYRPLILRDMFLLENQIPYSVLVALNSLKPSVTVLTDGWAASFFNTVLLPPPSSFSSISNLKVFMSLILCFALLPVLLFLFLALWAVVWFPTAVFLLFGKAIKCVVRWFENVICRCGCSADSGLEVDTELPTEPLPAELPTEPLPTELPTEPLPAELPTEPLPTELPTEPLPAELPTEPLPAELPTEPPHLLDLLRSELTGKGVDPSVHGSSHRNYNFRTISELKAAGILVRASNSKSLSLNNIRLKKGWIDSYLELPQIIIDDSTKTLLLNLAAYEMCPDGSLGQPVIISYICFLDSLIYNTDDVKELRSGNIMLNRLGSDEEVVNLFKELATNLSPDYSAFQNVIKGIEEHPQRHFNRLRMWTGQFIRIYFTSPWTAISLTAASFVIFLTLVQTIYSVLSFYKIE